MSRLPVSPVHRWCKINSKSVHNLLSGFVISTPEFLTAGFHALHSPTFQQYLLSTFGAAGGRSETGLFNPMIAALPPDFLPLPSYFTSIQPPDTYLQGYALYSLFPRRWSPAVYVFSTL
ncbi:MAG: hypothetical protein OXG16_09110 [Rhodospirillales bacterium]|nr:hypothetical protein [Rhodospirillales bacterium]